MNELMLREILDQPRILREALPDLRRQATLLEIPAFDHVVLTGSGDSLCAAMAVEHLFCEAVRRPISAVPSMSASRFPKLRGSEVTITVSVSGAAVRTVEAALAAKRRGSLVVAIVADSRSPLAEASDACIVMPEPISRRTPHTRDYTLTILALAVICERLGDTVFDALDHWPSLVERTVDDALAWAGTLLPAPSERRVWFLGAGPDRGTAAYGALKFWEAGGSFSWWDDLEEFGHGSQLAALPGDDAVMLAPGRSASRAVEMIPGMVRMGLRPILVCREREAEAHADDQWPGFGLRNLPHWSWAPFLSCLPVQALAYAFTTDRCIDVLQPMGGKPHGRVYEDVHEEWVRNSLLETDDVP